VIKLLLVLQCSQILKPCAWTIICNITKLWSYKNQQKMIKFCVWKDTIIFANLEQESWLWYSQKFTVARYSSIQESCKYIWLVYNSIILIYIYHYGPYEAGSQKHNTNSVCQIKGKKPQAAQVMPLINVFSQKYVPPLHTTIEVLFLNSVPVWIVHV